MVGSGTDCVFKVALAVKSFMVLSAPAECSLKTIRILPLSSSCPSGAVQVYEVAVVERLLLAAISAGLSQTPHPSARLRKLNRSVKTSLLQN